MINVKLIEILNAQAALTELAQKKISAITSYNLAKALALINAEVELFNKTRNETVKKYLEEGATEITDADKIKACTEELDALGNNCVTLSCSKLNINEFKETELSASLLLSIMWLLEE